MPTDMFTNVAEARTRPLKPALVAVIACVLVLTACAPATQKGAKVDTAAIQTQIKRIPGVDEADVGIVNAGSPGSYILDTDLSLDATGATQVRSILAQSAAVIAHEAPDVGRYTLKVGVPATGGTFDYSYLSLEQIKGELRFDGHYAGTTLEVTGEQLAAMAAATS